MTDPRDVRVRELVEQMREFTRWQHDVPWYTADVWANQLASTLLAEADVNAHSLTLEFRRFLSDDEWRDIVTRVRALPYIQALTANAVTVATTLLAEEPQEDKCPVEHRQGHYSYRCVQCGAAVAAVPPVGEPPEGKQ
jgi:hypothetical protein